MDRDQPGEGLGIIQFVDGHMSLLAGLRLGEHVTVGFTVRGADYHWEGASKYLVVLMGQQVASTAEHGRREKSVERRVTLGTPASGLSDVPTPMPFSRGHKFEA